MANITKITTPDGNSYDIWPAGLDEKLNEKANVTSPVFITDISIGNTSLNEDELKELKEGKASVKTWTKTIPESDMVLNTSRGYAVYRWVETSTSTKKVPTDLIYGYWKMRDGTKHTLKNYSVEDVGVGQHIYNFSVIFDTSDIFFNMPFLPEDVEAEIYSTERINGIQIDMAKYEEKFYVKEIRIPANALTVCVEHLTETASWIEPMSGPITPPEPPVIM